MLTKFKLNKTLIIILMAGLAIRLILFFHFLDNPKFFWDDDSNTYIYTAENMLSGNGFSWSTQPPYHPDAFRTPGYPVFLLLHKYIFGNYVVAMITQSLLAVGVALVAFLLAKKFSSSHVGYWIAAIFLGMPFSILISLQFLTQSLFAFVLILAIWNWIHFLESSRNKYLIITAVLLPLLAYIRPIAQFIYLPFLVSFIYAEWINKKISFKKIFKVAMVLGVLFFIIISPWLYRNYIVFGNFSLSSIVPMQMYLYDAPATYAYNHNISYGEAAHILSKEAEEHFKTNQGEFSVLFSSGKYLKQRALDIMFESPKSLIIVREIQFFKFFIRDGIHYWFNSQLPPFEISLSFIKLITPMVFLSIIERFILFGLFLGMIVTLFSSFYDKDKERKYAVGFLMLIIFYFAVLTGVMSSAGFRYPVEAIFIFTGILGLVKVSKKPLLIFGKIFYYYKKFAYFLGKINTKVLLTLVYFILVPCFSVIARLKKQTKGYSTWKNTDNINDNSHILPF